ncbi:MAG: DNA cytosine methyltransferase [Actinomycetota bacterium]|nr:DNA cytosine methyltransferase [Actinomycetota bacterium]
MKRVAVSLFSGAGGMDLGVAGAGFEVLAHVEMDPHCCETLRAAVSRESRPARVVEADVRSVEPSGLMAELELVPGELDLLCGGPPCQSFSQIGKQGALKDDRGLLLFQMVRFAEAFRPKAIFIEQVTGLLSARDKQGHRGEVLQMLLSDLESLGYVPKWKVVNAADHGVPQLRKRVFIVATQEPNGFRFPEPTHGPANAAASLFSLLPYATVGEVIGDLDGPSSKNGAPREDSHVDVTPAGDRRRIHGVPEGSFLAAQTHLPKEQLGKLTKKDTTKFLRVSRERPANTLRGGEVFFHPTEDRYLTPREYLRIHGYPDNYLLKGPIRGRSGSYRNLDQHRQIANSVPPPIALAISKEIERTLACQKSSSFSGIA